MRACLALAIATAAMVSAEVRIAVNEDTNLKPTALDGFTMTITAIDQAGLATWYLDSVTPNSSQLTQEMWMIFWRHGHNQEADGLVVAWMSESTGWVVQDVHVTNWDYDDNSVFAADARQSWDLVIGGNTHNCSDLSRSCASHVCMQRSIEGDGSDQDIRVNSYSAEWRYAYSIGANDNQNWYTQWAVAVHSLVLGATSALVTAFMLC